MPLFQRPYVWSQEGQWEPLWEDVLRQEERLLETGKPCSGDAEPKLGRWWTLSRPSLGQLVAVLAVTTIAMVSRMPYRVFLSAALFCVDAVTCRR